MLFRSVILIACGLVASALAVESDCASLPTGAHFYSSHHGGSVANTADGRLRLSFEATSESLESAFGTSFATHQDLTAHSLLSFNLHKTVQPSSVYVAVKTEYGVYRSDAAALFEGVNTITVDLASDEFSLQSDTAPAFDEPIVGLSRVQAIVVHLVATEAGAVSATLADAIVCAAAPSTADDAAAAATVTYTDAKDAALAYPDVASLSAALTAALQSANQLQAEIGEIKEAQRRAERGFDQFAARSRESLEHSVTAISEALQASVKQSSANSHLLKQAMSSVRATLDEHSARIEQLEASFASLRTLQVAPAEKLKIGRASCRERV